MRALDRRRHISEFLSQRANGSFLWVTLTLLHLERTLFENNNLVAIAHQLAILPTRMDQIYGMMMTTLSPEDMRATARTLQVMKAWDDARLCDLSGGSDIGIPATMLSAALGYFEHTKMSLASTGTDHPGMSHLSLIHI